MDLPWGDARSIQFVTNVGLITSNGPYGYNNRLMNGPTIFLILQDLLLFA